MLSLEEQSLVQIASHPLLYHKQLIFLPSQLKSRLLALINTLHWSTQRLDRKNLPSYPLDFEILDALIGEETESLDLSDCSLLTDDCLINLAQKSLNLISIKLDGTGVTDQGLIPLILANTSTLTDLSISGCDHLTEKLLRVVAQNCLGFERLEAKSWWTLSEETVLDLASSECAFSLSSLTISGCWKMEFIAKGFPNLTSLNILSPGEIDDDFLILLSRNCINLQHVDVKECWGVTEVGLEALLTSCCRIRSLDASACDISDDLVFKIPHLCAEIERISFNSCQNVTDSSILYLLQNAPQLSSVSLSRCEGIGSSIVDGIVALDQLEELRLVFCRSVIYPATLARIASNNHCLKILDIGFCREIDDDSLVKIAQGCPLLENLNVSGSRYLTDDSICSVIMLCSRLNILNISRCKLLTDRVIDLLSIRCQQIEQLRCSGCLFITSDALTILIEKCKFLQYLDSSGIRLRSQEHIKQI
eukprot:TRINITY_DN5783_c0_g1_i1.p1 TRINITY_DN5783_c0_g1~~TRINITY_DN5783_c0_g1_i1.p1  ORF type:complete len:477 (-),score=65.34 TRINITY_DN5783_c0_g1_i1:191-1621(-)